MKTFLFFAATGSLMVVLVHWIRSLLCRGKDLYVGNTRQRSRPVIMARLRREQKTAPDIELEHAVSRRLYPED